MSKYKLTVVELVTYERIIEAESLDSIKDKIDNWEYDDFEVDHTHIIGSDLQDLSVEEVRA
jgi:hypothetical protein